MSQTCQRCYKVVTRPCQNETETADCRELRRKARFAVYEIEHAGDVDAALEDLKNAGCTEIKVLATNFDDECMAVSCELPAGVTRPRDLDLKVVIL